MMINLLQIAIGFLLSLAIAWLGYRRQSLSPSGAVGAVVLGTVIFGCGGWEWGLLLIAFFVSSSALTHYRRREKATLAEKFAKTGQRDLGQALANGGWGAVLALIALWAGPTPLLFAAFVGAMATVNADTWATELGVLNPRPPRLITTWRPVAVGSSGGVSPLGTAAATVGALLIALLAWIFLTLGTLFQAQPLPLAALRLIPLATLGGLLGSLFDSLLGATVQGIYWCETCGKETERQLHTCGTTTRPLRGWRWLNNDWVNFLSSILGSLLTAGLVSGWVIISG